MTTKTVKPELADVSQRQPEPQPDPAPAIRTVIRDDDYYHGGNPHKA